MDQVLERAQLLELLLLLIYVIGGSVPHQL